MKFVLILITVFSLSVFIFYLYDVFALEGDVDGAVSMPVNCGNNEKKLSNTDTHIGVIHWGNTCEFDTAVHCANAGNPPNIVKSDCNFNSFPQVQCPKGCVVAFVEPYTETPLCNEKQRENSDTGEVEKGTEASCTASCRIKCIPGLV